VVEGDVVGLGETVGDVVGDAVGVAVGDVTGDELGPGDGPGDGPGVGADPTSVVTSRSWLIPSATGCVETVGAPKVGIPEPPFNIATVPAGETKITLEFWSFAVAAVQTPLQKYSSGTFAVGVDDGSQSFKYARPRSSNLIVTGKVTPFGTIVTLLRPSRFIWRLSLASRVPFWFMSVINVKFVVLIVTPDISVQTDARRFTESNLARSRLTLNSRATFRRSKFSRAEPNRATASAVNTPMSATTISISMTDAPR
jgi:hypothetical protein